jgi:hypothetical protein
MCSRTFDSLVGSAIRGSVGEPWNFESEAGTNAVSGIVDAVSASGETPQWLLCRIRPFVYSGSNIEYVVVVLRYRKKETFNDLLAGKRIGVNLVFDPHGFLGSADGVPRLLTTPDLPFLAGSIEVG